MAPAGPRQSVRFGAPRAEAVLTAVEVIRRVTERQDLDPANGAAVRRVTGTVGPALRRLKANPSRWCRQDHASWTAGGEPRLGDDEAEEER